MKKHWQDKRQYLGFNDHPFMIVGVPVLSFIIPVLFFSLSFQQAFACFSENFFPSLFFTFLFWSGDRWLIIHFRKRFPLPAQLRKRLFAQGIAITFYTLLMSVPMFYSEAIWKEMFPLMEWNSSFLRSFSACLFVTALVISVYESAFFIDRWKQSITETEVLKKENAQGQLQVLKNQVNPHFLFNSLNTLAAIIPEDPQRSVLFVQKLSLVYRNILDLKDKSVVTLKEELECLENYRFLLETRFGDNIRFEINVSKEVESKFVVPLSLQILAENAVKHNIVSQKKPLYIKVNTLGEWLTMENNLQPKIDIEHGTGTGLSNINERCKLTFGKEILVEVKTESFVVSLPLISIEEYSLRK